MFARRARVLALATVLTSAASLPPFLAAQDSSARAPVPATPRSLRFTTDEGTWMSLDVSPDGRTIVFDLLGDLYTLPIAGGTATRITVGPIWDSHPRFSPDGKRIVFVSDRTGAENLWIADVDGKNPRAVTRGDRDPLTDIRNTTSIRWVMKNGRLYEAATLTEIWPRQKPLARLWWESPAVNAGVP